MLTGISEETWKNKCHVKTIKKSTHQLKMFININRRQNNFVIILLKERENFLQNKNFKVHKKVNKPEITGRKSCVNVILTGKMNRNCLLSLSDLTLL